MLTRPYLLLLLAEGAGHGYELVERLGEFGIDTGTPASTYRTLREMERAGLVQSVWELSQTRGPARRVYSVTAAGRRALDRDMAELAALEQSLAQLRSRHASLPQRAKRSPARRSSEASLGPPRATRRQVT